MYQICCDRLVEYLVCLVFLSDAKKRITQDYTLLKYTVEKKMSILSSVINAYFHCNSFRLLFYVLLFYLEAPRPLLFSDLLPLSPSPNICLSVKPSCKSSHLSSVPL